MIVATEHATLGRLEVTGVPVKLRGTPGSVRRSPPVHGQHSAEILTELGYGSDEIATLVGARTIGVAG
jgi:crotonobetainyl-CoA:carnitine CoA-transferase CaiB-like acyl-CoA transferase